MRAIVTFSMFPKIGPYQMGISLVGDVIATFTMFSEIGLYQMGISLVGDACNCDIFHVF